MDCWLPPHRRSVNTGNGELVLRARLKKRVAGRPERLGQAYAELKVVGKIGFAPDPAGKVRNCATFIDGIGIPATAKNKKPAWLFVQWATGKRMLTEVLRTGSGTPARLSCYDDADVLKGSAFPPEWFETTQTSLKMAR